MDRICLKDITDKRASTKEFPSSQTLLNFSPQLILSFNILHYQAQWLAPLSNYKATTINFF